MKCLTKAAITLILTASASLTIVTPASAVSRQIGVPAEAKHTVCGVGLRPLGWCHVISEEAPLHNASS